MEPYNPPPKRDEKKKDVRIKKVKKKKPAPLPFRRDPFPKIDDIINTLPPTIDKPLPHLQKIEFNPEDLTDLEFVDDIIFEKISSKKSSTKSKKSDVQVEPNLSEPVNIEIDEHDLSDE